MGCLDDDETGLSVLPERDGSQQVHWEVGRGRPSRTLTVRPEGVSSSHARAVGSHGSSEHRNGLEKQF